VSELHRFEDAGRNHYGSPCLCPAQETASCRLRSFQGPASARR
jgi:hypothetical protein